MSVWNAWSWKLSRACCLGKWAAHGWMGSSYASVLSCIATQSRDYLLLWSSSHLFNMGTVLYSKIEIVLHGFDLGLFVPQGILETLLLVTTRGATGTSGERPGTALPSAQQTLLWSKTSTMPRIRNPDLDTRSFQNWVNTENVIYLSGEENIKFHICLELSLEHSCVWKCQLQHVVQGHKEKHVRIVY